MSINPIIIEKYKYRIGNLLDDIVKEDWANLGLEDKKILKNKYKNKILSCLFINSLKVKK